MDVSDRLSAREVLMHRLANDLAVIRSSAEILRDVPDLKDADRKRFAAAVLNGEKRLEELIPRLS